MIVQGAGGAIRTQVDGPEGAPWVVLSNSLGADLSMWDPQVPVLAETHRVLRYDTRGHGGSATVAAPFTMADLVADAVAVMDAHGVARADFVGLSMGGMTGLGVALAHPARLHRLVCADARADAPEAYRANWDARIARVAEGGLAAILDATLEGWLTVAFRAAHPEVVEKVRAMVLANDAAGYVGCCAALKSLDYFKDLGSIAVPTLYVCGDQDKGAAPDVMRAMAAATPGAEFVLIPDAAHVANINAPATFNAALRAFLTPT
ncbi:MAG TPA: 3-oxoadipate enol-lactonase [Paracoccaceae bacterium]|nr:3-oxoadipate enol-lactonase [Paracoccaceae bacterium]